MDDLDDENLCPICFDEECITLACGHPFGANCLLATMAPLGAKGKQFNDNPARCGLCKTWVQCEGADQKMVTLVQETQKTFEEIAAGLLIAKQQDSILKPSEVGNDFLHRHIFFLCNDCSGWYYVGRYDCKVDYKAEKAIHRICTSCRAKKEGTELMGCGNHGRGFLSHKCFYCCRIGGWFDEGKHLCDKCYMLGSKRVPQECQSKNAEQKPDHIDYCPGNHPDNGKEGFYYGCLVCSPNSIHLLKDY